MNLSEKVGKELWKRSGDEGEEVHGQLDPGKHIPSGPKKRD